MFTVKVYDFLKLLRQQQFWWTAKTESNSRKTQSHAHAVSVKPVCFPAFIRG